MARPRKPTKVLELTGAFKKDPGRKRLGEPKPTGGIGPFRVGSTEPSEIWDEIVASCAPGVLTNCDAMALEFAVEYIRQFRLDPIRFSAARAQAVLTLLGRFGMDPSSRARMSLPEAPKGSEVVPWNKFLDS